MANWRKSVGSSSEILTVTDHDGDSLKVWRGDVSLEFRPHPTTVIVTGDDLGALRDLINALPKEAFEDPKPAWMSGDSFTVQHVPNGKSFTYVRGTNSWRVYGEGAVKNWRGDDELVDRITGRTDIVIRIIRRGGELVGV